MDVKQLIRQRTSVRTYDGRPLEAEVIDRLARHIAEPVNPFEAPLELRMLDADEYGLSSHVIVGAHLYLTGKVRRNLLAEVAFGYAFEESCLYALSLGVGTVCLAGTLSRGAFERAMELAPDEMLPLASPLGYPKAKRSVRENLMRKAVGADERMAFEQLFFDGTFARPLTPDGAGVFRDALEMVRLAPSAVNKQPWRIVVRDNVAHLFERRTLKPGADGDVQKVDIGIAAAYLDLTMRQDGHKGVFVHSQPDLSLPEDTFYRISYELRDV